MKLFKLYVEGFDEEIEGVPEGHVVLISGPPGTMKSSLAYNILYHHAKDDGVRGLYVTLEQSRSSLEFHMAGLGMDPADVADELNIQDFSKIRRGIQEMGGEKESIEKGSHWMDIIRKHLTDLKDGMGYELLVIDSLPVLETISDLKNRRTEMFHFFGWLRTLGATTFIISEISPDPNVVYDEDYLADGLLYLTMDKVGEMDVYRRIRCVKMRGVDHSTSYFTLEYKNNRFQVAGVI
ncbi:MAG: RAD55 family ATPase [Thermoplasmata archaeon]